LFGLKDYSLFLCTGSKIKKLRAAKIYKWSWASALKSRDQVPSVLPHKRDFCRVFTAV